MTEFIKKQLLRFNNEQENIEIQFVTSSIALICPEGTLFSTSGLRVSYGISQVMVSVCVCDTYDDLFRAMSPLSSEKTAKVNEHSESRDNTETALLCSALLCGIFFLIWAYWWTKCLCKQWVTQHMVNHVWVYCNMMYKVLIKSN